MDWSGLAGATVPPEWAGLAATGAGLALLLALAWAGNDLAKAVILRAVATVGQRTKFQWGDALMEAGVFTRLSHLAPAPVVNAFGPECAGSTRRPSCHRPAEICVRCRNNHRAHRSNDAMNATPGFPKWLMIASWSARVIAAAILLQTLFFKFSGAAESVYIFTAVGQEPWGRYGSGVVELIASVLLFVPRGVAVGALLAAGTMSGAIFFHLTSLGIVVNDDGGLLFGLACVVLGCAGFLLWLHRSLLPVVGRRL